jgi:two-component system heavy metal sensor histidine kinase CusS
MKTATLIRQFAEASLAARMAAAVALFGLFVSGSAAVFGYWALSLQVDARVSAELSGKRELLVHLLSEFAGVDQIQLTSHRFEDLLLGHHDLHMAVLDPRNGKLLASSSKVAAESVARMPPGPTTEMTTWLDRDGKRHASMAGNGTVVDGREVSFVLSVDLEADQVLLAGYVRGMMLGLPLLLALVALGAWAVARTGLAPLKRFDAVASLTTTRNLGQRIDVSGLPRELSALAGGFNTMLDRIDKGVSRLSEFSADLAHEMRTPVATLLGRTQVALSKPRTADELRDVLVSNVDELDRLTRLIADMLFLARADQGEAVLARAEIDLAEEAHRVAEFLSVVAEERDVSVAIKGHARVGADQILVQRVLTNLLTNAIRHANPSSVVSVAVRQEPGAAHVEVSNRGQTIPPEQLDRIFERFVRLDAARTRYEGGGTGLGLAIVKSVVLAHGGSVKVSSTAEGLTTFSLHFPDS